MVDIYGMEVLKTVKNFGIIGIVFWGTQTKLFGVPGFELPADTPGRREQIDPLGQIQAIESYQNRIWCEDVQIPNTNCHLYFPSNGSQPSTQEAGAWSGARYNEPDNNRVTDWWVRVFGGNRAVNLSRVGAPDTLREQRMGFDRGGVATHIIQVNTTIPGTPAGFEQQFWQTFRDIAADPVGRVLLYRLLIEIRRTDGPNGPGCCGDDVSLPQRYNLHNRNNCRSINVSYNQEGCAFNAVQQSIKFVYNNNMQTTVLTITQQGLTTISETRPSDIGLFHEMLHWLHFLRSPKKQTDNKGLAPRNFKYPMRCYYGYPSEMCAWGEIKAEEIATILGVPNLNNNPHPYIHQGTDLINNGSFSGVQVPNSTQVSINGTNRYVLNFYKFINGDDLSENVYRASRGWHMRFGHVSNPINFVSWPNVPNRFRLAYKIAHDCYQDITTNPPPNWGFVQGEAIR